MYKPIKYLTTIKYKDCANHYFIHKNDRFVLLIETTNSRVKDTADIIRRVIYGMSGRIVGLKFYLCISGQYYAYVCISQNSKILDINVKPEVGMEIARVCNVPFYVEEKVLYETGLKITQEMLEEALRV